MKNMLLKFNIVLMFVVILFAETVFADDPFFTSNRVEPNDQNRYENGNYCKFAVDKDGAYEVKLYYYDDNNNRQEINNEKGYSFTISENAGANSVNNGAFDSEGNEHLEQVVLKGNKLYYINIPMGYESRTIEIEANYKSESLGTSKDENNIEGVQLESDLEKALNPESDEIPQAGAAEKVFSIYFLDFGDYANNFLCKIFGEDVTIDKIVFNKVKMLNANFFKNSTNSASNKATEIVRKFINQWFGYFKSLALVIIMVSIVVAGIRILLQTPQAKVKAYDSLKRVVLAVALIFFFPYAMKFAFEINEAIIGYISKANSTGYVKAVNISPYSNAKEEDLEFRSPKYVSKEGSMSSSSSSDNTEIYINNLSELERETNVMGIIRAFAGVTYRFVYVVIWYIMLAQVYILAFIYIKRYLTIAFLIIVYPLVVIGYVIDGVSGKRKGAFNTWSKKFFSSIFLQTLHAIMYGIISGILVNQILKSGNTTIGSQKINVILMIVATSFLFSGEKILTKFWKSSIDSSAERKGLRQAFGMPRRVIRSFKGK